MSGKILVLVLGFFAYAAPFAHAQTAECSDGSTSYSANFRGTCSHHGGVAVWNDEEMKDEANQWCDENPSLCANSHWEGIEGHGDHPADELISGSGGGSGRSTGTAYGDRLQAAHDALRLAPKDQTGTAYGDAEKLRLRDRAARDANDDDADDQ
jgi:hypothetical protein